jgi:hypothetical protein
MLRRERKEYRIKVIGYSNTVCVVIAILISGCLVSASIFYLAQKLDDAEKAFTMWTETNIEEVRAFNAVVEEGKAFREAFTWGLTKDDKNIDVPKEEDMVVKEEQPVDRAIGGKDVTIE